LRVRFLLSLNLLSFISPLATRAPFMLVLFFVLIVTFLPVTDVKTGVISIVLELELLYQLSDK